MSKATTTKSTFLYDPRVASENGAIRKMTSHHGSVYFEMTPGTAPGSANGMYICEFLALSSTSIFARVSFTGASSVTLQYNDGTNSGSDGYDATSGLVSGTSYQCKLSYTPTSFTFAIDNTEVCSVSDAIVDWGRDPLVCAYWGIASGGSGTYTNTEYDYPTMDIYKYQSGG